MHHAMTYVFQIMIFLKLQRDKTTITVFENNFRDFNVYCNSHTELLKELIVFLNHFHLNYNLLQTHLKFKNVKFHDFSIMRNHTNEN
jgi:hypothetical protein